MIIFLCCCYTLFYKTNQLGHPVLLLWESIESADKTEDIIMTEARLKGVIVAAF